VPSYLLQIAPTSALFPYTTLFRSRNTCVLFGDGAGAAILQNRANAHGLLTACMGADGGKGDLLCMPAGGSRCPATTHSVAGRLQDRKSTRLNSTQDQITYAAFCWS